MTFIMISKTSSQVGRVCLEVSTVQFRWQFGWHCFTRAGQG